MSINTGLHTEDKHLVKKVLQGDHHAFGIIIQNTEKLVARIVFDIVTNDEERKDLVQEIYLKVYQKLSAFKFQSKLSTWIGQISYNSCIDHIRKKKNVLYGLHGLKNDDDCGDGYEAVLQKQSGKVTEHADALVTRKARTEIINKGMQKLSPVYRSMITLYHNEELSYEEIGQITGMPPGTVKSYLFRARKELKNILLAEYKKEELW